MRIYAEKINSIDPISSGCGATKAKEAREALAPNSSSMVCIEVSNVVWQWVIDEIVRFKGKQEVIEYINQEG